MPPQSDGAEGVAALSADAAMQKMRAEDEALAYAQAQRMMEFITLWRDVFPGLRDLADHPGWEIMLHVFMAGHEGRAITTGDICETTGCWRPLALRYVDLLCERGLIARDESIELPDARTLRLTPETATRFTDLLSGYARGRMTVAAPH